jgi:glyoxylase-like metal-dependent hydrolase (beta-lactamase superfamily II)
MQNILEVLIISTVDEMLQMLSSLTMRSKQVAKDIILLEFTVANACIVSSPNSRVNDWVLVDTGLTNSADFIVKTAEEHFGKNTSPMAIILTHGHFDHVGSAIELAAKWEVPVYAHKLELPYLIGKKDYPVADPTVDEGMIAKLSPAFPHHSIDLGHHAVELPKDGSVPGLPGWKWVHTPGHTEGHICLYRETDGVIIAADALSTVKQESLISVLFQKEQISGPPKYLTIDWKAAEESVNKIHDLKPSLIIPSHGQPMKGEELTRHLDLLINNFKEIAIPKHGRYVDR